MSNDMESKFGYRDIPAPPDDVLKFLREFWFHTSLKRFLFLPCTWNVLKSISAFSAYEKQTFIGVRHARRKTNFRCQKLLFFWSTKVDLHGLDSPGRSKPNTSFFFGKFWMQRFFNMTLGRKVLRTPGFWQKKVGFLSDISDHNSTIDD